MDFKKIAFHAFASVNLVLVLIFQLYPVASSETWDFQIFFGAAHNVLTGMPVYGYYGSSHLPYFLFPWGAWFFIPFALLPLEIARVIFTLFGIAVVLLAFNLLANYFGEKGFFRKVLLFSMALWLGWLNIYVGQITYYLLGAAILVMFLIQKGHDLVAGLFFPVFLGFDQNWIGTANLPLTIVVIFVSGFILWKVRSLPVIPLLSLTLTASLVCAPRAYAYDLPLLIPAILWLSGTVSWKIILFWSSVVLILLLSHYSVGSYLLVLIVFGRGVYKAYKLVKNPPSLGCQP